MKPLVGKKYLRGFCIAVMKSVEGFLDSKEDCVRKRLFVKAEENDVGDFELVAYIEVEVIGITKEGTDEGFIHGYEVEVYRIPFPSDRTVRRTIIRMIREHPKFFTA